MPQYIIRYRSGKKEIITAESYSAAVAKARERSKTASGYLDASVATYRHAEKEPAQKCEAWNVWAGSCTLAKGHAGSHVDKYGEAFPATPNRKPRG